MTTASRRPLAAFAIGLLLTLALWCGVAPAAHAASDTFDRFDVAYTVTPEGVVQVRETVVLRFGTDSGRRGYERYLVTREPYDDHQDMTFAIDNVKVSSPSNVSTETAVTQTSSSERESSMRIRIGSADRRISAPTATYVISYDVRGALRTPGDRPEFYWDATGSTMGAIRSSTITVNVPGEALDAGCWMGPPRSTNPCGDTSVTGGTVRFTQPDGVPQGSLISFSVQMSPTAVANATPMLVERGDAAQQRTTTVMAGVGAASVVAIPLVGWLWYRRNGHDERYAGVPPGTVPLVGTEARVERNDPSIPAPVAFAPPRLALTHAGFLLDGHYQTSHLTATLVGLATHGVIELTSEPNPRAVLRDPRRVPDEPSALLVQELFAGGRESVDLDRAGELAQVSDTLEADARGVALGNGWFRRLHRGRRSGSVVSLLWMLVAASFFFDVRLLGGLLWVLVPATIALVITLLVVRGKMARGQRTAVGRAWTDQIEGFRTYIATAEADQLRFEEGEDIFSKYLPWAVLFGLAERWVSVCEQAIALGRLARPDAAWYGGGAFNPNLILWNLNSIGSSVNTSAAPSVAHTGPSFSSDTGFGGGSAFGGGGFGGGGGFSGGGGGGGGGGSW